MTETPQQDNEGADVPRDEEIDVEGPNESAPGHNPPEDDEGAERAE